ncbi:MAG: BamA/TamA family outer membrane protein [Syntrophales bacterium]|nr:BamA/TamA family outer membrane protein [Syntrophales bacterium]MDD5640943.1 BamA/TamA family outer membrane protein [Syntrophales bacterium]
MILCLALALAAARSLPASTTAASPEPLILKSVKITGAKAIKVNQLKEEMITPLPSRWPWNNLPVLRPEAEKGGLSALLPRNWSWKKPPVYHPAEIEDDLERLRGFYRRNGFYHTRITSHADIKDHQVTLRIEIDEGPEVKVTRVQVNAAAGFTPEVLADLAAKNPLKKGERFTEENYDALKQQYLNYLLDHGYPRAQAEGRVLLDEAKNTAQVEVTVKPGSLCYFGEVTVKGTPETPKRVILRKITFKKGQLFSFKEIYNSQQRLYSLDLFSSVALLPAKVPGKNRQIPVTVEVQEKKKRSLKLGLGYGSEDQFRARMGLRFRNLLGGGRVLDVDTKFSRLEYRVEGSFFNPLLWGSNFDFVYQTGWIRRYLPGFTDKAYFSQARLERDLPWRFRGYVGYGLEFTRPFNISEETLALLSETQTGKLYRASMMLFGLRQETMDNAIDPHRGGLLSLTQEVAPTFLGSQIQFVRTIAEFRRYQALRDTDFILAGRLKFGVIEPMQSTTDIPIFRRFFAGGYNSVRGYRLDYLGPRNPAGSPLGGDALLEGSIEARIPIYKELRAVAFLDFGNVYLHVRDLDVGQLKYSSGFGLRYHTFIGPIGLDLGFPLNPINPSQDKYRFHFTIGQAF